MSRFNMARVKVVTHLLQELSTATLEPVMYRLSSLVILACLSTQTLAISISSVKMSDTADANGYYNVVIKGSGFGTGPNIALFDDFNNQTNGSPVDLKKALIGYWSPSSSYKSVPKIVTHGGTKAFQIHDTSNSFGVAQIETVFNPKVSNIFVSYSVVVPEGKFFAGSSVDYQFPDVSSWKFTWIADSPNAIGSQTLHNVCVPTHGGKGSFLLAGNSVNYGWVNIAKSWSWHTKNYISYGTSPNSNQLEPGKIIFQLTGKTNSPLIHEINDVPIFPQSNTTSFDRIKFPGWFGNGDTRNFDAYYDDIYIATGANAFARVEISNAESVANSTINLTMPATSWSDTTIESKIHKEHLRGDIPKLFVRVHDKSNATASSVLICDKCPKPPTPL